MANVEEIKTELNRLLPQALRLQKFLMDAEDNGVCGRDPEGQLVASQFYKIENALGEVTRTIKLMKTPVISEGILYKNRSGRFAMNEGQGSEDHYFTSGSPIEVLVCDGDNERWVQSRIEHNGDYYLFGYPQVSLIGLKARIRGESYDR